MLFLLDSNIAITSDPLTHELEAGADTAMQFHQLATSKHHDLRVHPASRLDFDRIPDPVARAARKRVFARYAVLEQPPEVSDVQREELGSPDPESNDAVDHDLLAAVVGDAVEYLVTEDLGLHKKARRMRVDDRVLLLADALALLRGLHVALPEPPPAVERVKAHQLDLQDPIFDGIRDDYPDFENWFRGVSRNQRDALLIRGADEHAAICIVKPEPSGEFGVPGPLIKLSTFKVAEGYSGQKYGELLLKAVFEQAHLERSRGLFVTVFEKHAPLIALLEDFGFEPLSIRTPLDEQVMVKHLTAPPRAAPLVPLAHHIRYGPPALILDGTDKFVIPIEPRWHRVLFPDAEPSREQSLFPASAAIGRHPFGNALRKAYLCNAPTRLLGPGHPLLFYRSSDEKAVFVVGICEEVLVSRNPAEIAAAVGRRTVYTYDEIERMTRRREVLVIMFRQDRLLREDPITLADLQRAGLLTAWPQSITRLRPEGMQWLNQRLAE